MKNTHILALLLLILSTIGGCSSTADDLRAALDVCEPNGGLAIYKVNHSAVCHNGAEIKNPVETKKFMEKDK